VWCTNLVYVRRHPANLFGKRAKNSSLGCSFGGDQDEELQVCYCKGEKRVDVCDVCICIKTKCCQRLAKGSTISSIALRIWVDVASSSRISHVKVPSEFQNIRRHCRHTRTSIKQQTQTSARQCRATSRAYGFRQRAFATPGRVRRQRPARKGVAWLARRLAGQFVAGPRDHTRRLRREVEIPPGPEEPVCHSLHRSQ